ncbi:MAG: outer membrane lipoprotein carrier protein LolA [Syntrophomonadaceae bacterium]|nr:outer membrane lipoprotein carrier protein LolA [Syntrophomonadaceae bacterium]
MKKWIVALLVLTLMLGSLAGCSSKTEEPGTPAASQTPPAQQAADDPLKDLMESARQVNQMSFDIVMSSGNASSFSTQGKMYISGEKMRMEMEAMGMKMITITTAQEEVYMYNPDTNTAIKMTAPQEPVELPNEWVADSDAPNWKIVGEEKKDGYDCVVVTSNEDDNLTKMWLRKDIGMPVRVEQTTSEGPIVIEYKNYQIGPQDDSLFEIPAGVDITTLPSSPSGD